MLPPSLLLKKLLFLSAGQLNDPILGYDIHSMGSNEGWLGLLARRFAPDDITIDVEELDLGRVVLDELRGLLEDDICWQERAVVKA